MLKILQISDLHILPAAAETLLGVDTEFYCQQVLATAWATHGPFDLLLLTGDLAQHPCPAAYERLLETLQTYNTTSLCLPGNHDDYALMQAKLHSGQISCRKHMQLLDWQLICLNSQIPGSPGGELSAAELLFLESCLDEQPEAPTLIALHHPIIATGSPWLDSMQLTNSAALLALLEQHPQVKAVTFGHVHQELAANHKGIGLYAAPATCFQFQPNSTEFSVAHTPPGYRIFELYADGSLQSTCYWLADAPVGLNPALKSY